MYKIVYTPLLPAFFFSEEECTIMEEVEEYLSNVQIVSYVVLLLSCLGSCKIVGVELFGVLQLAYWSLVPQ